MRIAHSMSVPVWGAKGPRRLRAIAMAAFVVGLVTSGASCNGADPCAPEFCKDTLLYPYTCKPTTGFLTTKCFDGDLSTNRWCQGKTGRPQPLIAASRPAARPAATRARPASPHKPTKPKVGADLVHSLMTNWSLASRDRSYLRETASGHYELRNVAPGDLADVLDLESGDVLLDVNGYDLATLDGQLTAYAELQNELEFIVSIERGGALTQLSYAIVD